jgi:hypothetical protein
MDLSYPRIGQVKRYFKYKMTHVMMTADLKRPGPNPPSRISFFLRSGTFFLLMLALPLLGRAASPSVSDSTHASRLSGTWSIDKERSTAIDPWNGLRIEINASASRLTLERIWQGSYGFATSDSMTIPIDGSSHRVPMQQWPDNRHIGAFLASDSSKTVSARWLDDGRTLQVTTRLTVRISQGTTRIRTHSEYRVSPSGTHLTVLELRSTRPKPIRYTFERAPSAK